MESEGEVRRMGKQGERKERKGAAIVMEEREGKWCLVGKTEWWGMNELEGWRGKRRDREGWSKRSQKKVRS